MPISEKQSRELADLKLFYDLVNKNSDTISINYKIFLQIKEDTRLLKNDCIQIQEVQQLFVKYIKLKFDLNPRSEHEQQPLPQDMDLIDKRMKYWKERITELSHNIEFGFENLQALQFELGMCKMKMFSFIQV